METPMTKAERAWLRKQLQKLRDEIRDDTALALNEVIGEEAKFLFLERMTRDQGRSVQ